LPLVVGILGMILSVATSPGAAEEYLPEERQHWSFLPRVEPSIPVFADEADRQWIRTPIDALVRQRQIEVGLRPAPEADRVVLARRLTLQMTGLPPTTEELAEFVHDPAPDAYERLVDRLLASPHYGEHWGQHWLDLVRYAETEGFEYDNYRPGAWRYRDYVIDALNEDKPYDRFVTEQLAGDELPHASDDALVAAGFHRLGPVRRNAGNAEVAFSRNEVLTEQTDAVGVIFLGMTVGCARCHDHMFDPIRQKDYYQLQAFLAATQEADIQLAGEEAKAAWKARKQEIDAELKKVKEQLEQATGDQEERLMAELKAIQAREPPPLPTISSVKNDFALRTAIHLLARGDPENKGERLAMRALGVLLPEGAAALPDETPNPKTQLAAWITDPGHPLTARVIVNRLWQHHFGKGLVGTPNDFGLNGEPPSHPELLDYLANRLIEHDWQLKPLHRLILMSNTYRQASVASSNINPPSLAAAPQTLDPDNRRLWHFSRRRLTADEIRDAMLAVSGELSMRAGGPSVITPVDSELVELLYKPSQWEVHADLHEHQRRSVYLIAKRNLRLPFMEVFDQPDLQTSCARRESSTHAPQALELLNGRLANQLAKALADRLRREAGPHPEQQVERAFRLAVGRAPRQGERELALGFLAQHPLEEFALTMFNLNAFLYVE